MRQWQFRAGQIICFIGLAGCTNTPGLIPQAVVNTQVIYPNLPDVELPLSPQMREVHVTFPKDKNVFVTMDQQNWGNLVYNIQALKEIILQDQARIEEVNKERAEWRNKNKTIIQPPASGTKP